MLKLVDAPEPTPMHTERLLTEEELARDILNVDPSLVVRLRARGEGPPAVRVAPRTIRYRPADVARWVASRTLQKAPPMSPYGDAVTSG